MRSRCGNAGLTCTSLLHLVRREILVHSEPEVSAVYVAPPAKSNNLYRCSVHAVTKERWEATRSNEGGHPQSEATAPPGMRTDKLTIVDAARRARGF